MERATDQTPCYLFPHFHLFRHPYFCGCPVPLSAMNEGRCGFSSEGDISATFWGSQATEYRNRNQW